MLELHYGRVVILPDKDSCFSFPYSTSDLSAWIQRDEIPFPGLTITRKNLWFRTQRFPQHDWYVWIVFLHRRICPREERSISCFETRLSGQGGDRMNPYRTAALGSEVWQKWKRTSFNVFVKAYLADIAINLQHESFQVSQGISR